MKIISVEIFKNDAGLGQDISIPRDSRCISVANVSDKITLFFQCNPDNAPETKKYSVYKTDDSVPPESINSGFIGTVVLSDGTYHVFEA